MKSKGEAAGHMKNAGEAYKKIPDLEATWECYSFAIDYNVEENQFAQAAKMYQEMAELHFATNEPPGLEEAVKFYGMANDAFGNANSATYVDT
jgi:hypothetical protein